MGRIFIVLTRKNNTKEETRMGQKLKELRDTILADITKNYLDTASDEFLSETELAGLYRDADDLFAEAFRQRDYTSFFDNIETPADTQYDDVFPGEISPQAQQERYPLHSHPSNRPLSLNDYGTAGDIKHSQVGNKDVFVITRDGDIYFTKPGLASFDYSPNILPNCVLSNLRQ